MSSKHLTHHRIIESVHVQSPFKLQVTISHNPSVLGFKGRKEFVILWCDDCQKFNTPKSMATAIHFTAEILALAIDWTMPAGNQKEVHREANPFSIFFCGSFAVLDAAPLEPDCKISRHAIWEASMDYGGSGALAHVTRGKDLQK